jgi:EmrB/QacA subfamily drug resistance transporter
MAVVAGRFSCSVSNTPGTSTDVKPWPALAALCLGFFMILLDVTIVTVATPAIIADLGADVNSVVWVTSAYLLAYAVPLLITGRLGDRYGPKNLYLLGLAIFTLASLWCGLTSTIEMLIAARVLQGVGAGLLTPQTLATITRIFPAESRGQAMAMWGATSGAAMLVGPILGGVLVDAFGWEWIFFINVPIGILGLYLGWRLIPRLETHSHSFDWPGVVLSGIGMFLLVFGIQQGHKYAWNGWVLGSMAAGIAFLAAFLGWQARNSREPLVPLSLFRDRNFSVSNVAITTMSFTATAIGFPLMLWAQLVRGYTPLRAAMLMVPMAVAVIVLSPVVGRFTDKVHPRGLVGLGFGTTALAVFLTSRVLTADAPLWHVLAAMALLGVGNSMCWAPLAVTATRNLASAQAGAGSGVYNATRQVGSVLGSAAAAVLIDARLAAHGLGEARQAGGATVQQLPAFVRVPFSEAMSDVLLVPAAALVIGFLAVLLLTQPVHLRSRTMARVEEPATS